jgi:DnaK suppressor protein
MDHLSKIQRTELRTELQRQLRRLERSMKVTEEAARPVKLDQTAVGRLSRMDALQNQALTKNLQERELIKYALLEGALERLESGTYGTCSECAGAIPFERLLVFPEAPSCGRCAERS